MLEKRYLTGLTETEGKLVGYAAVFDSPSKDLGGFVEVIKPGAFTRTLRENPDIRALIDHDSGKVIGRTKAGTLSIREDNHGLRVEITPPDTTAARDLIESVRRGDVDGMSFAFKVPKKSGQRVDRSGSVATRHLLDVDLKEISVVAFPAYDAAAVSLRSLIESDQTTALHKMRLKIAEM